MLAGEAEKVEIRTQGQRIAHLVQLLPWHHMESAMALEETGAVVFPIRAKKQPAAIGNCTCKMPQLCIRKPNN